MLSAPEGMPLSAARSAVASCKEALTVLFAAFCSVSRRARRHAPTSHHHPFGNSCRRLMFTQGARHACGHSTLECRGWSHGEGSMRDKVKPISILRTISALCIGASAGSRGSAGACQLLFPSKVAPCRPPAPVPTVPGALASLKKHPATVQGRRSAGGRGVIIFLLGAAAPCANSISPSVVRHLISYTSFAHRSGQSRREPSGSLPHNSTASAHHA